MGDKVRDKVPMPSPQRLGKNVAGYLGERLDILQHLEAIQAVTGKSQWKVDHLARRGEMHLLGLRRNPPQSSKRLYLSTGIHGDEPAGPVAVLRLLEENNWPEEVAIWLCPCLNPTGFLQNRRENADGVDLNREYRSPRAPEVVAHVEWLKHQPSFDLSVCLHEDWEANGFYLYEVNPDAQPSLAERIIREVAGVCPIETSSQVDGWVASRGIIRPPLKPGERPQWPETLYLIESKTRLGYTFEAPSDFPMEVRVAALIKGVRTVLAEI